MNSTTPNGVKAVIFDVYGTLIEIPNPKRPYRQLLKMARNDGIQLPGNVPAEMMSKRLTLLEAAQLLGVQLSRNSRLRLERELKGELDSVRMFPEVPEVLRSLRERGYILAVCSNLAAPYVEPADHLLAPYIDVAIWSCDVGWVKPEPQIYLSAVRKVGVPASEVLMVGDTYRTDVAGAQAAGLHARLLDRVGRGSSAISSWSTLNALVSSELPNIRKRN